MADVTHEKESVHEEELAEENQEENVEMNAEDERRQREWRLRCEIDFGWHMKFLDKEEILQLKVNKLEMELEICKLKLQIAEMKLEKGAQKSYEEFLWTNVINKGSNKGPK
jgi:hypothetical protein